MPENDDVEMRIFLRLSPKNDLKNKGVDVFLPDA